MDCTKEANKKESLLQKIFSIKNSEGKTHKILTLFGLKLKFKLNRQDYLISLAEANNSLLRTNNALLEDNAYQLKCIKQRLFMLDVPLDYKRYWTDDNMNNIIPGGWGKYPEGFHPGEFIKELLKDIEYDKILDFGCAYGRLSNAFESERYIGIDLNPYALNRAKENNPNYTYMEMNIDSEYPKADIAFAHTVFLHNDDKNLLSILKRLNNAGCKYIVVSDVINKQWHNGFVPPTYYRSLDDYNKLMREAGYEFVSETKREYKRYKEDPLYADRDTDLSFLIYKKSSGGGE